MYRSGVLALSWNSRNELKAMRASGFPSGISRESCLTNGSKIINFFFLVSNRKNLKEYYNAEMGITAELLAEYTMSKEALTRKGKHFMLTAQSRTEVCGLHLFFRIFFGSGGQVQICRSFLGIIAARHCVALRFVTHLIGGGG